MTGKAQQLIRGVECRICGKGLNPLKPLKEGSGTTSAFPEEFYCMDCWLRELRGKTAESPLAKALDHVLLD